MLTFVCFYVVFVVGLTSFSPNLGFIKVMYKIKVTRCRLKSMLLHLLQVRERLTSRQPDLKQREMSGLVT